GRRENKPAVSNSVKKAPRETASVGIPRNAAAEARRLPQQPTGRQIEKRNKRARKLVPVRSPKIVTVRKKKKAPFPIAVVFSAVLLTLLFLFMMMNYAEIDRYNSEIAEMKATVTDLKAEADKLQGKLDKKDGAITGMQSYIEDELGMVKSDSLPKEYVSLLPEDVTTVIDRRGDEGGFGVLLSGLSEVIRNFLND
ncbi:MAG: hypothetical protein ACI3ZE_02910, partial [Candidatus Woodwardiibium sp.]